MSLRSWCAVVGIAALLAQGSSVGHMVLVEHVVCAEHGELVHGDALHGGAAHGEATHADQADAFVASASHDQEGHALHATSLADEEHAHEHCATSNKRRVAVPVAAETEVAFVARETRALIADAVEVRPSTTAQLLLAPKTSPPA